MKNKILALIISLDCILLFLGLFILLFLFPGACWYYIVVCMLFCIYQSYKNKSHQMMAINTYKEMKEQLSKLKKDVLFREYIGCELAIKLFYKRYEKWLRNNC